MDDLISRQAAIEAAYQGLQRPSNSDEWKRILEHINAILPEDVEPVKRGARVNVNPMVDSVQCSNCGYQIQSIELTTPYCPWCGARMEGGEE